MSTPGPRYLGDAVYAEYDGYHIWLYTSDGVRQRDRIALEPLVLDALNRYNEDIQHRREFYATARSTPEHEDSSET